MAHHERRNNSGSLWPNSRRRDGKQDPNVTGDIEIDGVEYWLDGWTNTTDAGKKWISLRVRKKEPRGTTTAPKRGALPEPEEDDIPF